jgi:hypothetical protein
VQYWFDATGFMYGDLRGSKQKQCKYVLIKLRRFVSLFK